MQALQGQQYIIGLYLSKEAMPIIGTHLTMYRKPTYKPYKLSIEFKYINIMCVSHILCVSHALVIIAVLSEVHSEAYKQLKLEHIRHITQNSRTRWMQSNG